MRNVATIGSGMRGSVGSHAGHIIGYTGGEDPQPIYCSGHTVSGTQLTGQSKLRVGGRLVAAVGDSGSSTCPCDRRGYTNTQGAAKLRVGGRPVVRLGDTVSIHGQGTGTMTTGAEKLRVV